MIASMLRRLVLLLLFMVLPLQAFASVHLALTAVRQHTLVSPAASSELHAHDTHHTSPDRHLSGHHHHGAGASPACTGCDICMPPLAFSLSWPVDVMAAVVAAAPDVPYRGILPSSFDRPPKRLA